MAMNIQEIFNKINELAVQNAAENTVLTRSDLAYELKKMGVENDSPEISKFVWECFQKSSDKEIFKTFVNNDKTATLIDEYKIPSLIENGKTDDVFSVLKERLEKTSEKFGGVENFDTEKTKLELVQQVSDLLNTVSGSAAVSKIQNEAGQVFKKYSLLTENYSNAKSAVVNLTKDFVQLRGHALDMYRRYASALTDIFGEKIKASMPEMFDFDSIEFLDTDKMLKNIELCYNSIFGKCSVLAGEVSDNFSSALKLSATQFGKQQDKRVGLIIAGVNMLSHYVKLSGQTTALRKEVQELKMAVSKDAATIKTDEVRLFEIYKILNDVYIPKSEIFAKASPKVFDSELKQLINDIYSTDKAQELKKQRDEILDELHSLERKISDAQMNVNYYSGHINTVEDTLKSLEKQYDEAKKSKPEAPSGLQNAFSFGSKKKQYERDIYDWVKNCEPVISKYEDLMVDIKIDTEELENQRREFEESSKRYHILKAQHKEISEKLSALISADPKVKAKVISRLEDIIKLLQIAKDISMASLEDRLIRKVDIKEFKEYKLPENISDALDKFKGEISSRISQVKEGAEVLQKGFEVCNALAQLETMKINHALSEEYYENEFQRIKATFDENVKGIDNQHLALMEIAKKINTAPDNEALKNSLIKLLGKDKEGFTSKDWDDFLSGEKIIEI